MELKVAVLAGDGIGPEISAVGVDGMTGWGMKPPPYARSLVTR